MSAAACPTPALAAEWLKNHANVPMAGLPHWFVKGKLTNRADIMRQKENATARTQNMPIMV
jgi:hypothetical protein